MTCKTKLFMTKRKAFTLIELLIVIAIIGILFIVLVSKVDFITDKAKATGVQTDFRSFQLAFDTVAKENSGFNTFGWDTGDANQDGKRNSYDEGDINKDGIQNGTEVFTGHKVYAETFTKVYSLKKNGTGSYDREALNRLETAINANLDPKLHITIKDDGESIMANGAKDPWNKEYHGWYITNAETDKKDRGAIVMYSDGANNEFGSEHKIANGIVSISIPGNNKYGKDDYAIVSCYTYLNGYGEVKNITTGFSTNQSFSSNSGTNNVIDKDDSLDSSNNDNIDFSTVEPGLYRKNSGFANSALIMPWQEILDNGYLQLSDDGFLWNGELNTNDPVAATYILDGDLVLPNDGSIKSLSDGKYKQAFSNCYYLNHIVLPDSITVIEKYAFGSCYNLTKVTFGNNVTTIRRSAFGSCYNLTQLIIPETVTTVEDEAFNWCINLTEIVNLSPDVNNLPDYITPLPTEYRPFHVVSSIEDSTLIYDNGFVWMEDDSGIMWLINDLRCVENVVLPNDYNGLPYNVAACTYYNDLYIKHLTLSKNILSLKQQTFNSCPYLESVTFADDAIGIIGSGQFMDCPKLNSVVFSNNCYNIESSMFSECGFETIVIPETIQTIDDFAFSKNKKLKYVTILNPNCIIDKDGNTTNPFASCILENIEFADGMVTFDKGMFYSSTTSSIPTIKSTTFRNAIPPTLIGTKDIKGLEAIYVPAESVDAYKTADGWSQYSGIIQAIS